MDPRHHEPNDQAPFRREHDSVDDFEHLGHDSSPDDRPEQQQRHQQPRVDDLLHIGESFQPPLPPRAFVGVAVNEGDDYDNNDDDDDDDDENAMGRPVPATPPPSAEFDKCDPMAQSTNLFQRSLDHTDPKLASMAFVQTERAIHPTLQQPDFEPPGLQAPLLSTSSAAALVEADIDLLLTNAGNAVADGGRGAPQERRNAAEDSGRDAKQPCAPPSPVLDLLGDDVAAAANKGDKVKNIMDDDSWNVVEETDVKQEQLREHEPPTKPLPPLPPEYSRQERYEMLSESGMQESASESESESLARPRDVARASAIDHRARKKEEEMEIAPKEIFRDMGLDAWFNPDRLNPRVAALIYWRDPKKSGIVFGAILGVLLSLAYFSLISVLAYLSLLALSGTVLFRIYKTVLQAVQKTSDGHPFKDILDLDLAVPAEKVHEVADVAVAHANAAVSELRRLFLVEDFVDSIKFGALLWCLTYVGSWFNGMTLIIIGVVALFTLPKVYETNQEQIDQNLALVQAKINEITAKVKAAIPLGKKAEPTKEE